MGEAASGEGPDLSRVANLADFIRALGDLRAHAGSPSYRALAKQVGALLKPPREVSFNTVADMFEPGRRRLDQALVLAVVRALGVDAQEAEAWRQTCVRVHSEIKNGEMIGVFRQLPSDSGSFTGREAELAELRQAIETRDPVAVPAVMISAIEGMPGIGKTQLAVHAAHEMVRAGRFGDLQLYVNLRGFDPDHPPATPAAVLDGFLRQLGVRSSHIPVSVDERAAMFRDRISGKRALILLDNASDEEQVRPLIPADPDILVLITSRRSFLALDGAAMLFLDVFPPDDAIALLARIAGADRVAAEPTATAEVAELCGGLPLAVALAGAKLRSRASWAVTDLVAYLRAGGLNPAGPGGQRLRLIFDLSYRELPDRARRLFALLGTHPGPEITAADAAALSGVDLATASADLEWLQDEHLLTQPIADRYVFHDLVHCHASTMADVDISEEDRSDAGRRLLDYYIAYTAAAVDVCYPVETWRRGDWGSAEPSTHPDVSFADAEAAQSWLDTEAANLVAAGLSEHAARHPERCQRLAAVLYRHLEVAGRHQEAIAVHTAAAHAARERDDRAGEAKALTNRAGARWHRGEYEQAVEDNLAALELARAAGPHARLMGQALNNLGIAYDMLSLHDEALDSMAQALALFQEADDRPSQAAALHNIASVQEHTGRTAEALESQSQGLVLAREIGDQILMAYSLWLMGTLEIGNGRRDKAREFLLEALGLARGIGHKPLLSMGLNGLAQCVRVADAAEALEYLEESLAIATDSGDRYGQAMAQQGIGDVFLDQGEPARAAEQWRLALTTLTAINARGVGELLSKLAMHGVEQET